MRHRRHQRGRQRPAAAPEPEHAVVSGRVASPSDVMSPMTGLRAAMFEISAGVRYVPQQSGSTDEGSEPVFDELGSMVVGDVLLITTDRGVVEVPARDLVLKFPGAASMAVVPVTGPLPPALAHVMQDEAMKKGVACYRELAISHDDVVTLDAVLAPSRGGAAYRTRGDASQADWIARGDLGPVTLSDESIARSAVHTGLLRRLSTSARGVLVGGIVLLTLVWFALRACGG